MLSGKKLLQEFLLHQILMQQPWAGRALGLPGIFVVQDPILNQCFSLILSSTKGQLQYSLVIVIFFQASSSIFTYLSVNFQCHIVLAGVCSFTKCYDIVKFGAHST